MNLPPAIFFDLDDTILSFSAPSIPLWQELCDACCRETGLFQTDHLFQVIRQSAKWFWSDPDRHRSGRRDLCAARRQIVKRAFETLGSADNIAEAYRLADAYSTQKKERIDLFPGAVETLASLQQQGIRLALVTNGTSEDQNEKIERFALRNYFEDIFIEGELGFGKPDIRVFSTALERMKLSPQEVWMVGDNLEWDVAAPQHVGMYGVWHDWKKRGLPDSSDVTPDRIIHCISEFSDVTP